VNAPPGDPVEIRPLVVQDAEQMLALALRNRAHLESWEPLRDETWFTLEAQSSAIERAVELRESGRGYRFAIVAGARIVGAVGLNEVVRGAFENAYLGYWVDVGSTGRGYATQGVRLAVGFAFEEAQLHRVQAAVMPRNAASIRVVEKVGFRREGHALRYLRIAGVWEDHHLFALTREEWPGT
jgi:ribosomal-protein-alanine N-acetyltransferase